MKKLAFSLIGVGLLSLAGGCATRALAREIPAGFPESSARTTQSSAAGRLQAPGRPVDDTPDVHSEHEHQTHQHQHDHSPHAGHDDHQHNFGRETADPEPAGSPGEAPATEVYTCPMHPEVVSHEPGQCPKCGMHLEKKK